MHFTESLQTPVQYELPRLPQRWMAEILDHTYRFRISTLASLHRVIFPSDFARNSITKICSAAVDLGYLQRHRVHAQLPGGPRTYYTIGPYAVARLGWHRHRSYALNEQRLAEELAILACCCEREHPVARLLPEELAETVGPVAAEFKSWPYYLQQETLFTVRVFRRGGARSIANKVAEALHRYAGDPRFYSLIQQQRFGLTIITSHQRLEQTAELLAETLLSGDRRGSDGGLQRSVQLAGYAWEYFLHFA